MDGSGFGAVINPDIDAYFVRVYGIDTASSTVVESYAPRGSRVFSPVTSLVRFAGSQSAVKRALGLDSGIFSLAQDRELTTFNPATAILSGDADARAEGERLAAANLRVLAIVAAFSAQNTYLPFEQKYDDLGAFIGRDPGFLFTNATMSSYLTERFGSRLSPKVISAMAHLINAYAATIPVRVGDEATARRFMLGIHGYLAPELGRLLNGNSASDADAALAVTTATIQSEIQTYRDGNSILLGTKFFPGPNFAETSGNEIVLQADLSVVSSSSLALTSNDLYVSGIADGPIGLFGNQATTITSVTVPAVFSSSITATLGTGTFREVRVRPSGAFRGRAYFDYAARHPSGATGTGRVYVNFR